MTFVAESETSANLFKHVEEERDIWTERFDIPTREEAFRFWSLGLYRKLRYWIVDYLLRDKYVHTLKRAKKGYAYLGKDHGDKLKGEPLCEWWKGGDC